MIINLLQIKPFIVNSNSIYIENILITIFVMLKKLLCFVLVSLCCLTSVFAKEVKDIKSENALYMELKDGIVVIEMLPEKAPGHVYRVKTLVREGFYDGITFHRVIEEFMVQTGDPTGTGNGGSKYGNMYAEFNDERHVRGTVSMARGSNPDSADSQFFIVTGEAFPHLDNQYTVWGKVVSGMEYIDKIKKGDPDKNGKVEQPADKIVKMIIGSDMTQDGEGKDKKEDKEDLLNKINEIKLIQDQELRKDNGVKRKGLLDLMMELNEK